MNTISIIIPAFNEAENLSVLYEEILSTLEENGNEFEVIFVDDGSRDNSLERLKLIAKKDERVKIISFAKNYGQTAALSAGVNYAKKDLIVTLDADLQNDPRDIPLLLNKLNEGYDLVTGWRKNRHDGFFRVFLSKIANLILIKNTGVRVHDHGCSLKIYKRDILNNLDLFGEMHRLIIAYSAFQGVKIGEIITNHRARKFGSSHYGFSRIFKVLIDLLILRMLLKYSFKPAYFFGFLGFYAFLAGMLSFLLSTILRFYFHISYIQTPLLLLTSLFFILGAQLISTGILADLILRGNYQKGRNYFIKEKINF